MSAKRIAGSLLTAAAVAASLALSVSRSASLPPQAVAGDATLLARGADLAAIGNCAACHTRSDGKSFAGGRPMKTPFGTIYSTNITPDSETGIGKWSLDDFRRAMHEGVDREGGNLYPAFPYDHFARVTDDDVEAIYVFMMSREPVRYTPPGNQLSFPMSLRPTLSGWKLMFLERGVYRADPSHDAEWNRGAYLVEGLGHCGSCHTPRNGMGAEKRNARLAGGEAEGWDAPALNADSPAPSAWTAEQLYAYLRQGWERNHGTAVGPMREVVHDLSQVPESDIKAIARYVAAQMEAAPAGRDKASSTANGDPLVQRGEAIFLATCASCHENAGAAVASPSTHAIPLAATTSVNAPDARNVIHVVLDGGWPEPGEAGALMPGFEGAFTDEQLASVLAYVRSRYAHAPPWKDLNDQVRAIMRSRDPQ